MDTQIDHGIELISDIPGVGPKAIKGSSIIYNARFFASGKGSHTRCSLYRDVSDRLPIRIVEGAQLIDHATTLGKRQPIAAVEKTLYGMQAGGYREVLASPHLCYGELGVANLIPPSRHATYKALGPVSPIIHAVILASRSSDLARVQRFDWPDMTHLRQSEVSREQSIK